MHDDEAAEAAPEEASLGGLMERTQELTEDIHERAEVASKIAEEEAHEAETSEVTEATAEPEEQ